MKTATIWKMKMGQGGGSVNIGELFSKPARKVRDTTNTKKFCGKFKKAPADISWTIDRAEFDELIALRKDSTPGPDGIPYGVYRCAGGLGAHFPCNAYKHLVEGGAVPEHFAISRTVFIPKSSDIDENGRIIPSPEASRPLTLWNCDSKLLTSAICRGLHWYTVRSIHPSKRCVASRQMTDNIFEIETAALAHVACAREESGVLLTDFAAACTSVKHSWILSVIEKTELPGFIGRFLSIYHDSMHVEFAGATRRTVTNGPRCT